MPFATLKPVSTDHQEKHEGRLARALDIDRTQRVLDYGVFSTFPQHNSKNKGRPIINEAKTIWTGTEWSNDKQNLSEFSSLPVSEPCFSQRTAEEQTKEVRLLPKAPFK